MDNKFNLSFLKNSMKALDTNSLNKYKTIEQSRDGIIKTIELDRFSFQQKIKIKTIELDQKVNSHNLTKMINQYNQGINHRSKHANE